MKAGNIKEIDYQTASAFLLPRHYSGRIPSITKAWGWYDDNECLKAVCTFGKPASPPLCVGVCGKSEAHHVYELNRLCRTEDWAFPLSELVAFCLRNLKKENWIVVSYSDTAMNHHGYIYQACNFIYTGETKKRTDKYTTNGKHPRHYKESDQGEFRVVRSAKHRYVYFCTNSKKTRERWMNMLKYPVLKYPKGDNSPDYKLGTILKPTVIKVTSAEVTEDENQST